MFFGSNVNILRLAIFVSRPRAKIVSSRHIFSFLKRRYCCRENDRQNSIICFDEFFYSFCSVRVFTYPIMIELLFKHSLKNFTTRVLYKNRHVVLHELHRTVSAS